MSSYTADRLLNRLTMAPTQAMSFSLLMILCESFPVLFRSAQLFENLVLIKATRTTLHYILRLQEHMRLYERLYGTLPANPLIR